MFTKPIFGDIIVDIVLRNQVVFVIIILEEKLICP
jgi:hypothetical protein